LRPRQSIIDQIRWRQGIRFSKAVIIAWTSADASPITSALGTTCTVR